MSGTTKMDAASPIIRRTNEYVGGLGELTKTLGGLTPAVAAFIMATVLIFFAATLVTVDHLTARAANRRARLTVRPLWAGWCNNWCEQLPTNSQEPSVSCVFAANRPLYQARSAGLEPAAF
jgi:hypothetical protein